MIYVLKTPLLFENQIPSAETLPSVIKGTLNDAVSCIVTRTTEGMFSLTMSYLQNGENAEHLVIGNEMLVPVGGLHAPQFFIISSVRTSESGIMTIEANHISYNADFVLALPFAYESPHGSELANYAGFFSALMERVNALSPNQKGSISVGGDGTATVNAASYNEPISLRGALYNAVNGRGDIFLEAANGDSSIYFNVKKINFEDIKFEIRYGVNLESFLGSQTTDDFYTHVLPYVMENGECLTNRQQNTVYQRKGIPAFLAGTRRIKPLDLTGKYHITGDDVAYGAIDSAMTNFWLNENPFETMPVEIEVGAIPDDRNTYELGAVGHIIYEPTEYTATAAITSLTYDVLQDRVTTIGVGEISSDVTGMIAQLIKGG